MKSKTVIFDLDDTLYNEVDYLLSAYKEISYFLSTHINNEKKSEDIYDFMCDAYQKGSDVFTATLHHLEINNLTNDDLLRIYRNHIPLINLSSETISLLDNLLLNDYNLGLITDGRSVQQRNKIKSLGIEKYFQGIVISEEFGSEKPELKNFTFFEKIFPNSNYFYIADNPKKDFIGPKKLGWTTICLLDNGRNIHKQNFNVASEYLPDIYVKKISEFLDII